jgi:hypothetical protein
MATHRPTYAWKQKSFRRNKTEGAKYRKTKAFIVRFLKWTNWFSPVRDFIEACMEMKRKLADI